MNIDKQWGNWNKTKQKNQKRQWFAQPHIKLLTKSGIDCILINYLRAETFSKTFPWEQLGSPLNFFFFFFLFFYFGCIFSVTAYGGVWLEVFVLPWLLSSLPPYSLSIHWKKNNLTWDKNVTLDQKFICSLISSPIVLQSRAMHLMISLLLHWLFKMLPCFSFALSFISSCLNTLQCPCALLPTFQPDALKIPWPVQQSTWGCTSAHFSWCS